MTYIIQSEQIPELSEIDLANLRDGISQAIDTYVRTNECYCWMYDTRIGIIQLESKCRRWIVCTNHTEYTIWWFYTYQNFKTIFGFGACLMFADFWDRMATVWAGFNGDPVNNFAFDMHQYFDHGTLFNI